MERSNKLVTGLIAGAMVGTVAGLLLAPKPGKQIRQMLAARADQYAGILRRKAGKGKTREGNGSSNDPMLVVG